MPMVGRGPEYTLQAWTVTTHQGEREPGVLPATDFGAGAGRRRGLPGVNCGFHVALRAGFSAAVRGGAR